MMIEVKSASRKKDHHMEPKPLSKLLKIVFTIALVLFSLDFGIIKYKSFQQKITLKLCFLSVASFAVTSFYIIAYHLEMTSDYLIYYSKYIIQYYAHVLILLCMPQNKTFCTFLENLNSIDVKLGADSNSYRIDIKLLIYFVATVIYKVIANIVYCSGSQFYHECIRPAWVANIFIPFSAIDFPLVVLFFIFYSARSRLAVLRKVIEGRNCKPIYVQNVYKSLIDSTENVKKAFEPTFIVTLFFEMPALMAVIYQIIEEITNQSKNPVGYSSEIFAVFFTCVIIFAPAVIAGSISSEVKNIKINLHNMILERNDPQQVQDTQKLINYIEARPFKFRVLGIIPMDATFPMTVLNLYVTYIIVLLQLTHLY